MQMFKNEQIKCQELEKGTCTGLALGVLALTNIMTRALDFRGNFQTFWPCAIFMVDFLKFHTCYFEVCFFDICIIHQILHQLAYV